MVQSTNLTLTFSSESSIEEELKRESTADIITIAVSHEKHEYLDSCIRETSCCMLTVTVWSSFCDMSGQLSCHVCLHINDPWRCNQFVNFLHFNEGTAKTPHISWWLLYQHDLLEYFGTHSRAKDAVTLMLMFRFSLSSSFIHHNLHMIFLIIF